MQAHWNRLAMPTPPATFFTIGHSTRTIDGFLGLLEASRIACVVDVRRLPGSRTFPHFNAEPLRDALAGAGIDYWHALALGGRRAAGPADEAGDGTFWTHRGFRNYARYAQTAAFEQGLRELEDRARRQRCVLMCAEAVWWRCHRRIIADHLLARGHAVFHIMGPHKVVPATLTRGAVVAAGAVAYPDRADDVPAGGAT